MLRGSQNIRYSFCHKGKTYASAYISDNNKTIDEVQANLTQKFKAICQELNITTIFD